MQSRVHIDDAAWISKATRYRYSLPVLAELERDQGCKFVTLVRRLDASDRAIRQALDYLIELGWADRNPGYGHPSRPEYILSEVGHSVGPRCLRLWVELNKWSQPEVAQERWPLSLLFEIGKARMRFSDLLKSFPGLTARSLSLALKRLIDAGLATREIVPGNPPQTEYRATPWGLSVVEASRSPV